MSVIYNQTVRTARLNIVKTAIEAGSGPGVLQIGTANMASVLVSVPLDDPADVTNDVLTLLQDPVEEAADAAGTAAAARIRDSDGTDIVTGLTVGTSATDVIVDSTTIGEGQNVRVTSATITHPST